MEDKYTLILADIHEKEVFINKVNAAINEGWVVSGGVATACINDTIVLCQGLIKASNKDK